MPENKKVLKQMDIIRTLGVKPVIDPAQEVEARTQFLMDYLRTSHARGFVLGISGGQDSTLAGKLAQRAVEKLRAEAKAGGADCKGATSKTKAGAGAGPVDAAGVEGGTRAGVEAEVEFIAVRLPHGVQADEDDAQTALDFIQPDKRVTVNIAEATRTIDAAVSRGLFSEDYAASRKATQQGVEPTDGLGDFNLGNVKARLRMVAQYAIAGERNLLVIGTDHAAENITGFFTKFGDGAADVLPLAGLNKRQGAQLLQYLEAPASTWEKVPTADLEEHRPALPDEEALGVSYQHIDDYLEGKDVPQTARDVIETWWEKGQHKRHLPASPTDTWWR